MSRAFAPLAVLFALVWLALVVTAPRLPTLLATSLYGIGALICHQRPERSFHVASAQLPVCARCLGIYAGAAFGLIVATGRVLLFRLRQGYGGPPTLYAEPVERAGRRPAIVLFVAAFPTMVTLVVEWAGLWDPGNVVRAVGGTILGAGVAAIVVTLHYDECTPRRPIASSPLPPI